MNWYCSLLLYATLLTSLWKLTFAHVEVCLIFTKLYFILVLQRCNIQMFGNCFTNFNIVLGRLSQQLVKLKTVLVLKRNGWHVLWLELERHQKLFERLSITNIRSQQNKNSVAGNYQQGKVDIICPSNKRTFI